MRILLATDGSGPSRTAAEFLSRLKFTPEDKLIVLHVLKEFVFPDSIDPNREFKKAGMAGAKRLVADEARRFKASGLNVTEAVYEGDPAREVTEAIEEQQADLAVLGHKGHTEFHRFLLGGVSHHVLRLGKSSVLIVRKPPPADRAMRALYCTDGSAHARFARDLFIRLPFPRETEVDVLSVVDMQVTSLPEQYYPYSETSTMMTELRKYWMETAEGYVVEDAGVLRRRFGTVRERVTVGVPEAEILQVAEETGSDLVVMGSSGMRGIKGVLIGDVSHRVVKHANSNVLVGKMRE